METISPSVKTKICEICGCEFVPTSGKQKYCRREITVSCIICGNKFTKLCTTSGTTKTCSEKCNIEYQKIRRIESSRMKKKICKWCGREFTASHFRVVYCDGPHYKNCSVCGKEFEFDPKTQLNKSTCSKECFVKLQLSHRNIEEEKKKQKKSLLEKYGVDNSAKIPGSIEKAKKTSLEKYGHEWYTQTDEYKERARVTSLEKYGTEHWLSNEATISKRKSTCLEKYGSENVFSSDYGKSKIRGTLLDSYNVTNPSQVAEFRKKAIKNSRNSSLETKVATLLREYNIDYVHHYQVSDKETQRFHEFDFYLPKYKLLIDCDGLYFHSYLSDPNGKQSLDYYDETRLSLIPEDHKFHVIVEGQEEHDIKNLVNLLESEDSSVFDYEGYLFNWCRSIGFPYPDYSDSRMISDYSSLCKYTNDVYRPTARMGESLIKKFHKSLYSAHVNNFVSPVDAWYDDALLKKVIKNRLIYRNNVDPSKILAGFNVSKICPRVSIFNPVLAKYIVTKYLSDFDTVFDPFSGFSGRMLGVSSTGKTYIGQDLNEIAVKESNEIVDFLNLKSSKVIVKDVLDSQGEYPCLVTCPPYGVKEHYNHETVYKSCDEWIDEILTRFKCRRYVFIVDTTSRYESKTREEIKSTSHFVKLSELLLVIDR